MKKILLATVAILGLAGAASAADLRPVVRPVVAPVFNWTGCYLGGYVGGAWSAENVRVLDRNGYNLPFTAVFDAWNYNPNSSFLGGGTAGCNWQPIGSPIVLGIEGEAGYLRITGSAFDPLTSANPAFTQFSTLSAIRIGDWYGMVTGRLGYAWDRALVYVKGGGAFVDVQTTITDTINNPGFIAQSSSSKATWTVGGGLEWAFDWNWSVKAEYMFIGLDNTSTCGFNANPVFNTVGTYCWNHQIEGVHTAKIGLNYRFGAGAVPVIARY